MNANSEIRSKKRIFPLAVASALMLLGTVASVDASAQGTTVSYGRVTAVRQVDLANQSARNTGAALGGLAGVASGSGQSGSNRALRGIGGAAVGRRVAANNTNTRGFEYTVTINGQATRIVTENSGLRVGDCASVERGSFTNIRLAPDERCDAATRSAPSGDRAAADACIAAKDQVLAANTDAEFDRAERRMRLVCD
jgi:outer membrane lipoprotein SlyB